MELNVKKSFWVALYGNHDVGDTLTIPYPEFDAEHRKGNGEWKFKEVKSHIIREVKPNQKWRHLGNFQDNKNRGKFTIEEVNSDIEEVVGYMCKRMIAPEGALMGYNVKCLPKIMYKLKHSNLNETEICSLQKKVNAKMKSKLNVSKRFRICFFTDIDWVMELSSHIYGM